MTDNTLSARERILHTAHDLFYQHGVRATGIDRIIKEAGVTKVTFYRHFPAKNDLILAFLGYRHTRWINWFRAELEQQMQIHGALSRALPATLGQWFASEEFRGCAFINTAVEMAHGLPESLPVIRQHKQAMTEVVAGYLPDDGQSLCEAQRLTLMIDGAIVMAQREESGELAVALLQECLTESGSDR